MSVINGGLVVAWPDMSTNKTVRELVSDVRYGGKFAAREPDILHMPTDTLQTLYPFTLCLFS